MDYSKSVCKNYFLLFLLVIFACSGFSQNKGQDSDNKDISLITADLQNEQLIRNIFLGNFLDIPYDRDVMSFSILMNSYVTAYSERCGKLLPANKIELTYQECDQWISTRNGWGVEVSRECLHWVTVPTGIYASPEMYHSRTVIENLQAVGALGNLFKMITNENPAGMAMNLVQETMIMKQDMIALFTKNDCNSQGLKRFEENLRLFALNKQPIVLGRESTQKSNLNILSKDQNFDKLIDDLIYELSKKWAINKYERQSASGVSITSRDNNDLPAEINATYRYQGWGGRSTGSVRITFTDGLPECLYFFDYPTTCRTADRKIVAQYADGGYQIQ